MSGRKVFTAGEVLQAADVNDFLMDQSVMVFAGTAARGSAIPSPSEGMVTYRSDDDVVEVYNGASFVPVGPGQILQVVSTVKTDTFSTTSTSFVDITGVSATITPSSTSSKILVMAEGSGGGTDDTVIFFRVARDGTALNIGDASSSRIQATWSNTSNASPNTGGLVSSLRGTSTFLDSPASTSSLTYTLQVRRGGTATGTIYVGRSGFDLDNSYFARVPTNLTLMEVAG